MFVKCFVSEVFGADGSHFLTFVVAEDAKEVEPYFATDLRLDAVSGKIAEFLEVDMLFGVEELDEFFYCCGAHLGTQI